MLYQLKVKVEAHTIMEKPFRLEINPYVIILNCSVDKILNEIIIQKHIENFYSILPNFEKIKPHQYNLKIPSNPHFEDIINIFQTIESLFVFSGINKIRWDIPERSWIFENPE